MNFWEAREAARKGHTVRRRTTQVSYKPAEMLNPDTPWYSVHLDEQWEIVERPELSTYWVNVYRNSMGLPKAGKDIADRAAADSGLTRLSCLELTVDENGKLVSARNV